MPGQKVVTGTIFAAILVGMRVSSRPGHESQALLVAIVVVALILGVQMVMAIGGADMPVVISLLNAFTGLATASTGFVLSNNVLIIAGTLVGASGSLLTQMMGKAMNRSLANIVFGAFGTARERRPRGRARRRRARSARRAPTTSPSCWRTPAGS